MEKQVKKRAGADRKIGPVLALLIISLAVALFASPALADTTIQFTQIDPTGAQQINVYTVVPNGTMFYGTYNVTDQVAFLDGGSYVVMLKPVSTDLINQPMSIVTVLLNLLPMGLTIVVIGAVFLGIVAIVLRGLRLI